MNRANLVITAAAALLAIVTRTARGRSIKYSGFFLPPQRRAAIRALLPVVAYISGTLITEHDELPLLISQDSILRSKQVLYQRALDA